MKTKGIIWFLLACSVVASAQEVKVRKAWVRTFPRPTLGIFPDNLGNIAAASDDRNGPFLFLLDSRGRTLARARIPIPLSRVGADSSGRIFVVGDELTTAIHGAAFAPLLANTLWVRKADLTNAGSSPSAVASAQFLVPDETGGFYTFGHYDQGVFVSQFTAGDAPWVLFRAGFGTPTRKPSSAARSPSGDVFWIAGSLLADTLPSPTIYKYSPATMKVTETAPNWLPGGGSSFFSAATCDSGGNLILVGWHTDDVRSRYGRCHIMKMDPQLNVLWQAVHGPLDGGPGTRLNVARAVAVDANDDIVMTGDSGTVKYSPTGEIVWEAPITGAMTFNLDRFGSVLLSQPVERTPGSTESEITKLNADGTLRWQIRFHDGRSSNVPGSLVLDDDGNVYLATSSVDSSAIVKFVERGGAR